MFWQSVLPIVELAVIFGMIVGGVAMALYAVVAGSFGILRSLPKTTIAFLILFIIWLVS